LFYLRVEGSTREVICLVPVITVFLVLSGGLACPPVCDLVQAHKLFVGIFVRGPIKLNIFTKYCRAVQISV